MNYETPESSLTLEQGLAEYYGDRDDLIDGRGANPQAAEFFRCHDAAHVVFGCGTTLPQESLVKIWSLFATTAGLSVLRGYRLPESKEIYGTLGFSEILRTTRFAIWHTPIVLVRCLRIHERWPWSDFESYLSTPLVEIREKFGINVLDTSTLRTNH